MDTLFIQPPKDIEDSITTIKPPTETKRDIFEFKGDNPSPKIQKDEEKKLQALRQTYNRKDTRRAAEVVTAVESARFSNSTFIKSFGTKKQRQEAELATTGVKQKVVDELYSQGYQNPRYEADGNLYIDFDGQSQKVDSSILAAIGASKFEATGSMGGAAAGAAAGAAIGTASFPIVGTAIGAGLGALAGGMAGAYVGRGADIVVSNMKTVEDVEDKLLFAQMEDAGVADAVFSAVGTGAMKVAGKAGGYIVNKGIPMSGKSLKDLTQLIIDKNLSGAVDYAKRYLNVSNTEAEAAVRKIEEKVGPLRGNSQEKILQALTLTKPGGEDIVNAMSSFDPIAGRNYVKTITDRAAQVKERVSSLDLDLVNSENKMNAITQDLDAYTTEVANFYTKVKQAPIEFTKNYSFDYDAMGVKPILETIGDRIEDPIMKERFLNTLKRTGESSDNRGFVDLIDLRQEINYLIKPNMRFTDKKALINTLKTIDDELDAAADLFIPEAQTWKELWSTAKSKYSEMKQLEENVLYKALTTPGLSQEVIASKLSKYVTAGDDTFVNVVSKLSKATRSKIDNVILDKMVDKHTVGSIEGAQAIDFPALASDLSIIKFESPKTKQLAEMISEMSKIYKNDPNLARATGAIPSSENSLAMATDIATRAKLESTKTLWKYIKQFMPGDKAKGIALTRHMAELFKEPVKADNIEKFRGLLAQDRRKGFTLPNFDEAIQTLQNEFIRRKEVYKQFMSDVEIAERPDILWGPSDITGASRYVERDEAGNIITSKPMDIYGTLKGSKATITLAEPGVLPEQRVSNTAADLNKLIFKSGMPIKEKVNIESFVKKQDTLLDSRYRNLMNNTSLSTKDINKNMDKVSDIINKETMQLVDIVKKQTGAVISEDGARRLVLAKFAKIAKECME
ncbi:MAG: hypothetical protein AB7D38_12170 [Sulfurimonas sp.]|uniref:hypothetical protein n=1 Tax=Sulfurimonas sp. TaxID=2022749 RepID=UPI003D122385